MTSNEIKVFLLTNKPFIRPLQNIIFERLQSEEYQLQQLAEQALIQPDLHYSAVMQLGRVSLLREVVSQLKVILGEQNNG